MNSLNLNSHNSRFRPSLAWKASFYRTKPQQKKSEPSRSTGSELSSAEPLIFINPVKIPTDLKTTDLKTKEFFKEFNNAQSNKELANLFERLDDQLRLKNQSKTDSPGLNFHNYLNSPEGSASLEKKISENIKNELKKIDERPPIQNLALKSMISNFEKDLINLFLSLQSLNLNQSAQKLLEHYNNELDAPRAGKKLGETNGDSQSFRQVYPFELSFTEQISLLLMIYPNQEEELEPIIDENIAISKDLWESGEPEVFEHYHLGNLLDMHSLSDSSRGKEATSVPSTITDNINQLIEREDFKNTDSLKILNAYLTGIAKNHQTEVNKLLNKSLSFYFQNFDNIALKESLMNLTNLFQVAASKEIIPVDAQKALGEDFLGIFKRAKLENLDSPKPNLCFLLSSTVLNEIDNEQYSKFISENIDAIIDAITELTSENPILIIKNLNLDKVDSEQKDDLQRGVLTEIQTKKYFLRSSENSNAEEISSNPKFTQFARMVLAAVDKGFITEEQLEQFLPNHAEMRNEINIRDFLNSLASITSSAEAEKGGMEDLLEELLNEASEEGEEEGNEVDPQDPFTLFMLNISLMETLQEQREKDPVHFRSLITQSLDPERLALPDEFEEEAINPFNHLLLTKAFCDPTKKLYQEHDSNDSNLEKFIWSSEEKETDQYIDEVIKTYKSETESRTNTKPDENDQEHELNEQLIFKLIDKSFHDPDAHDQSTETITDVYFNLLDNHYINAANRLLEGGIMKACNPLNRERFGHLRKIYNFARENDIIHDITKENTILNGIINFNE
jgi:hypothetical protein